MLTANLIIASIEEHKKEFHTFGVKKLILIGSYAHAEQKRNSDIDFLVEFKKGRGLFDDYIHLLHYLEDLFHKKVDLGEPTLIKKGFRQSILKGMKIEAKL